MAVLYANQLIVMNINKALSFLSISFVSLIVVMSVFYFLINISVGSFDKVIIKQEVDEVGEEVRGLHKAYYMDKSFYGNLESLRQESSKEKMYGGIISHHFLMAREIAGLLSMFANQKPKTIVIIGPNHFGVGDGNVLISEYDYDTPYGVVNNNRKIVTKLIGSGVVELDERPFAKEHSISTLVGFIKYFLPDTNIVPIIVKRYTPEDERDRLANELIEILSEDDIVFGSVDFSHHINEVASEFHDDRTISIINDFDFERLQSTEVDCPESLEVVLRYLESKGAKKMRSSRTNMANRVENPLLEDGTSYLFASFVKGEVEKNTKVSVLSFGDLMLGRDVGKAIGAGDNPFEEIQGVEGNFVRGVDIISANLEGPITKVDKCSIKAYSFKFDPSIIEMLNKYNFNALNLSNNHTFDCYSAGYEDTKKYLNEGGIFHFGGDEDNKVKIKEIAGKKIAFVGIDTTVNSKNNALHKQYVEMAKNESDYVIVNIHWGQEYKKQPNENQIVLAHDLVDSGADVIIGHHPHAVQSAEIYKNKAIFYSVGNFIFDQVGVEENQGLGVGVVFSDKFTNYYLFPYDIKKYHPQLKDMKKAKEYCDKFISEMGVQGGKVCKFSLSNNNQNKEI